MPPDNDLSFPSSFVRADLEGALGSSLGGGGREPAGSDSDNSLLVDLCFVRRCRVKKSSTSQHFDHVNWHRWAEVYLVFVFSLSSPALSLLAS